MQRQPVESSNLQSVGYENSTNTLEIEFKNGGIYQYFDVPESEYKALMSAESHGKYFIANIRDKYRCQKIQ